MNLFPPGIAEGAAFCNRITERHWLKENIERIQHTVIMAPRRYGKSSLITCVIHENELPHIWIDFLSVATKEDVVLKILKGAKQLLFELSPELKKLKQQAKDFVKSLTPELSLGILRQSITFHLGNEANASIDEMLLQLDDYAGKTNKKAIIVFDEFQQISELKENAALEAFIRHAVERSKNITYIFSGSNRHLLQEMFGKSSRPLYRLCQPMVIDRISTDSYTSFINKAAQSKWKEHFSNEAMRIILSLTECHPFYVNALCNKLWSSHTIPVIDQIRSEWDWYVTTYKSIIVSDILTLSLNQKKMIKELSKNPEKEPYSAQFCAKTKISLSSIRQSLDALAEKDIIYLDPNEGHRLLDPALRYYMLKLDNLIP